MSDAVVNDPVIVSDALSSVDPPVLLILRQLILISPILTKELMQNCLKLRMSYLQFHSLFSDFAKHLEVRFSNIDQKFSQVMPATSNVDSSGQVVVIQDAANLSFSAPSPVAVHTEHTSDKDSYVLQTGVLEIPLGMAAAAGAPSGDISLTEMEFRDLEGTIRFF